ncbi:metal-sulfur cluster assembly factor [Glycomyces tarimensis]
MRALGLDGVQGRPGPSGSRRADSQRRSRVMTETTKAKEDDILEAMKDVVDPELGINVVDLGLIYGVHVDEENIATLDMTLTSAACPLTDVIEDQSRSALTGGAEGGLVSDLRINWVWIPPWGPDKITDEGRDQLRALGFNV